MAGANSENVENAEAPNRERDELEKEEDDETETVTDVPPECLIKHPLQHAWTLWYFENNRSRKWEDNLSEITSFDTVEDFWSLYNHIKLASDIKTGADYNLFKKGIKPMWEDESNHRGGKWIIPLERNQRLSDFDRLWLDIILCLIGEAFDNADEIRGAVASIRGKGDKISIWTGDGSNKAAVMEIGQKLKERLRLDPKMKLQYVLHKDTMVKTGIIKSTYEL